MNIKNISEGRRFLRLGIIGGVVLLSGLLVSLFISGKIALPVLIVEEAGPGGGGQFLKVGDGELQIGSQTIRVSRFRMDMGNLPIHNLAEPTNTSDAATKGYVDAAATGPVFTISCGWITSGNPPAVGSCTPAACPADYFSTVISCRVLALASSVSGWGGEAANTEYTGRPDSWHRGISANGTYYGSGGASGECYRTCYK